MVKKQDVLRNITIGLTDGLTIPFALAAGLTSVVQSSFNIAAACISLAAAGAITMGAGSYLEQKKSGGAEHYVSAAFTISISYIIGGIVVALPYLFIAEPIEAFKYSVIISLAFLFIAGYYESKVNDVNGWAGAFRVMLTGAAAATAA
ncbi:MAG: VIT1/CCC1 transporter family protein, partial [Chitinophagaceae bacterium]|nr:VIT1/CCC1 transporter family protein [Chitinophagaceae bacterium]